MQIDWTELPALKISAQDVGVPWIVATKSFDELTHLRIEAEGEWGTVNGALASCGPDGIAELALADAMLVITSCRFGALIGKLGGSSANHVMPATPGGTPAVGEPFAVGSYCIVEVPNKMAGPLFVGFNTRAIPMRVKTLSVKIYGGKAATEAGATQGS